MKSSSNHTFINWAGNQQCHPSNYFQPQTEVEIVEIVNNAREKKKKVRVVGAGHSWSGLVCTKDYLINLDNFNRILYIDKDKNLVTAQAGMRLFDLNKILDTNGLALVNLGSVSEQSVAGVTATGTHGTGINYQVISSQIVRLKILKSDGSSEVIDRHTPGDLLNACRVNLGVLGIILEVTLQCTKKFNLKEVAYPMDFEEAVESISQLVNNTDHVKFWWFPHVKDLMVYNYTRTKENKKPFSLLQQWFFESFLAKFIFTIFLKIGSFYPTKIPFINNLISKMHYRNIDRIDSSYKVFNVPMPPKHRESEYSIPMDKATDALLELKQVIDKEKLKINFVLEVRFVQQDNIWLSPAYKRDSCYIGAYQYGKGQWKKYLQVFEEIMIKHDGRPHWAKEFTPDNAVLTRSYPKLDNFRNLKKQLDPVDLFSNTLTSSLLSE